MIRRAGRWIGIGAAFTAGALLTTVVVSIPAAWVTPVRPLPGTVIR